jgi:hypothetical protein
MTGDDPKKQRKQAKRGKIAMSGKGEGAIVWGAI